MRQNSKQISNPFSTGGGGNNFETNVQASFVALMMSSGFAPCLPLWPIKKIKLQGKYKGFDTDDLIVYISNPLDGKERRLLGQIKHSISITKGSNVFGEVIQATWNDFKNPDIFNAGEDVIALITGPLSATDINDVRTILERARHSEDSVDFLTQVSQVNFSSESQRRKLEAFRFHLKNANDGVDLSDNELWQFMKSYHLLGYDLDIKAGVTLSLLQSLIGQYSPENAHSLWSQIINEVRSANQNAGTITIESLPDELRVAFEKRTVETIPADLILTQEDKGITDWISITHASDLAIACLMGSWDEKCDSDMIIAGQVANEDYGSWIAKIREVLQMPESPLQFIDGKWSIKERIDLWQVLGSLLFDEHLDRFKQFAVEVLKEQHPMFELPPEERYAAGIHGKVSSYSGSLKNGLAEGLALIGGQSQMLTHCSAGKAETIAILAIREIFEEANSVLWGSLNRFLPLLAEAAPNEFLNIVESALLQTPCPFTELFNQEGDGLTGGNYITGLLWALETLAWNEEYLARVTVILGEIDVMDPGGRWANRPANSLTTIFLPWLPQTTASVEKRKVAMQTLQKELPDIAWKILLTLLPNQHQTSSGSSKPAWRWTLPEEQTKGISQQDYWEQVSCYTNMAVDLAKNNLTRLSELVSVLNNLPQPAFDNLLEHLESDEITGKLEAERYPLWSTLESFITNHKKYSDSKWALKADQIGKLCEIAESLAPQTPEIRYQRLFSHPAANLFDELGNWEEQRKILIEKRKNAIREILAKSGFATLIKFADDVESAWEIGLSLGFLEDAPADSAFLPNLLDSTNSNIVQLISGFIWARCLDRGWVWADQIDMSGWSISQIRQLLIYLPFQQETWERVAQLLKENEVEYWSNVSVNPYYAEGSLEEAINKLLEYNRPNAALSCIYCMLHSKQPLDQPRTVKALLAAVSSKEPPYSMDVYHTIDIIKELQKDPETNPDDLFRIEWAYLSILDRDRGSSPMLLERRLASHPEFFCEVIRLIYTSKNEDKTKKRLTEDQTAIATNAFRLLRKWQTPPGLQSDGSFSADQFNKWLDSIKKACSESGHLEVALSHLGNVLIHCPPDSSGLWINSTVGQAINTKDAEDIRRGFYNGIINSRGVHRVDPTGAPEKELAAKYRQQASDVENQGYQRFTVTLRSLADSYEREAKQIIDTHGSSK